MNHFELFEIPIDFSVKEVELRKKYYALSKKFHPDKNNHLNFKERENILQKSATINEGFKILSDKNKRISYLLEVYGLGKSKIPSPKFLEEILEINELLMELGSEKDENKIDRIKSFLNEKEEELSTMINVLAHKFKESKKKEHALKKIHEKWSEKKYLLRIREKIDNFER